MRRSPISILSLLVLALWAPAALGQTVSPTTGAINGRVADNTGAVMPGVQVTITSPAMMGSQTAVTDERGGYRFPSIPPGEYRITYELAGFTTMAREGIVVGLGFTATVNVDMQVAAMQETVTVTGESPVIDTQATKITTNFQAEQLANLPSARDFWAILAESPATQLNRIDVGGSAAGTQTTYWAYGFTGQNRPMVEGIVATEGTGAAGFYYDYGSFEEVSVGTAAHTAEMPWAGVQMQFISKSGGNNLGGTFYGDYENESIQSRNIDSDQLARGAQGGEANRIAGYHDVNVGVGGPIQRDKLWWYFSFRDQDAQARYANFPVKPHRTRLTNYGGKATYQLGQKDKLIAYVQYGRKHQPTRLDSFLIGSTTAINLSEDSTWEQLYWGWVWKGEWNHIINENMFFEVRAGQFGYDWPNKPKGTAPRKEDLGNNQIFGGNRDWQRDRRRNQVLGSLSLFKSGWGGEHNFKFGGEIFRETVSDNWKDGYPGDVVHVLRNGAPIEVYLFEAPSISENGLWTYSGFISDAWQVNNRVTLNLGLRLDRYRAFLPEQEHPVGRFNQTAISFPAVDNVIDWNLVSPRLGASVDLAGDGKTLVKANYGQYWFNPGADFLFTVNPNSQFWNRRYAWTDPSGDGVWQPGEEGRLIAQRGGSAAESLDPNLEDTYMKELAAWFERELMPNFGLRTGFVWRGVRQKYQRNNARQPFSAFNVPIQIPDPGPDGIRGNADDGSPIAGFNLDPSLLGRPAINIVQNTDAKDDFYTWEITGNRRFTNRWSLLAGFSYTWNRNNDDAYFGNGVRANDDAATPNDLINTVDGRYHFTNWALKVHGTYEAPWGVRVTPILRHQAGQPYGRTFLASLNYGSVRILAEPLDTRRQDNITLLDTRVEKVFRLSGNRSVSGFLDVFNIFNANPAQNIAWSSGTSFLRPLNIVPPRVVRLGVKFGW